MSSSSSATASDAKDAEAPASEVDAPLSDDVESSEVSVGEKKQQQPPQQQRKAERGAAKTAYMRQRTAQRMNAEASFAFMPGQKHRKGIRAAGCLCCDPDNLDAQLDNLLS